MPLQTHGGGQITVTRTDDANAGWDQLLEFHCVLCPEGGLTDYIETATYCDASEGAFTSADECACAATDAWMGPFVPLPRAEAHVRLPGHDPTLARPRLD